MTINNDGWEDLVAYSPGSGPDAEYQSDGSGGFVRSSITVNGTYTPVAVSSAPYGDGILWFGPGSAPDALWANSGTTLSPLATQPVSVSGPLVSGSSLTYLYNATGPDQLYSLGQVHASTSPDIGAGARPFAGDFDGNGEPDIFFYRPGSATDSLGYVPTPGP